MQSSFGWHVIKRVEAKQSRPTFEESVAKLRNQQAGKIIEKMHAELEKAAKVQTFNPDGSERKPAEPKAE